jgi:hypothetical protein
VEYVDDNGLAQWQVDGLTRPLRAAASFAPATGSTEWLSRRPRLYTASAPRLSIPPPELRIVSDKRELGRQLTLQLRSARGAEAMSLIFRAPELSAVRVNGLTPPQTASRGRRFLVPGWHAVVVSGAPQVTIEIRLRRNEPIEAIVADRSFALPAEATPLTRARNASPAVPSGDGDGVRVRRRLRL